MCFVNTASQDRSLRDNSSLVLISREGGFVRSGMEVVDNIFVYSGADNPLLISRVYSTKWLCSYNMLYYPFDTQVLRLSEVHRFKCRSASSSWLRRGIQPRSCASSRGSTPTPGTGNSLSTSSGRPSPPPLAQAVVHPACWRQCHHQCGGEQEFSCYFRWFLVVVSLVSS